MDTEREDFNTWFKEWSYDPTDSSKSAIAWGAWQARAAIAAPHSVDWLGLALDLEAQAKRVESQATERAMLAAAHGLRLMGVAS